MTRFSWRKATLPLLLALALSPAFASHTAEPLNTPSGSASLLISGSGMGGGGSLVGGGWLSILGIGIGGGMGNQHQPQGLMALEAEAMGSTDKVHVRLAGLSTGGSLGVMGSSLGGIWGVMGTGIGGGIFGIVG